MKRLRGIFALAAFAALLAASSALAADLPGTSDPAMPAASSATAPAVPAPTVAAPTQPDGAAPADSGVEEGATLTAPPQPAPVPAPKSSGGTQAGSTSTPEETPEEAGEAEAGEGEAAMPAPGEPFEIPSIPSSSCAGSGVPPVLIPIYQRAAAQYGLGPQGAAVLAGINEIETAFGTNLNVSSAGALGWMQFIPSSWETYGVDANGDGVEDPYNPEDAIYAAASYLSAAGMPADTYGAIYAYNHADWYVADVLANAACYAGIGSAVGGGFSLTPQLQELSCRPAEEWRDAVPDDYLTAFEGAAARYELGRKGVWALAAVARLESNFGRGMGKRQMQKYGPLGLDGTEWRTYAVDGDEDGKIRRSDPDDSAATLARLIWSRGSLRAGIFTHNQAHWYVEAVLAQAEQVKGGCTLHTVDWAVALPESAAAAPIDWDNLTLSNDLELRDLTTGAIDPRIVGLIGAITQEHELTISALRSDHSEYTASGYVSNHFFGRAMDIAAVDGVSCTDTAIDAPCANLARTLAYLPQPVHPTELIYCFDVDGPGEAFALPDHCDHVHVGFDE
jgi:hypothetical protein